jgi:hypothetical protein
MPPNLGGVSKIVVETEVEPPYGQAVNVEWKTKKGKIIIDKQSIH